MEILSKSQRNALWRALAENGLTVGDFSYDRLAWEDGATIHHTSSQSLFQIYRTPDYFTFTSQVGDDPPIPLMASKDFENIVARVGTWGREASDWLDTLDLWESVPQTAAIPGELTPDSDNTPFSASEQTAISAQLKEIAETVKKTYELTAEQSARLDEKFEEAEKASRRMGRKDWGMFFGESSSRWCFPTSLRQR